MDKKHILVAEDDKAILEVVKMILEDAGYVVTTAETMSEIEQIFSNNTPHLLLLDIWLGGANGEEIARKLKSSQQTKNLPVIIISANNETEKIAHETGVEDFLQKPFNIDDLLFKIKKHLPKS